MEVELQFLYRGEPPLVVPTRLADLELHRSRTISILDTYFDTASLDLRRGGCSLRVRQAENVASPLLTLKGPSRKRTGAKRRYEAEVEIEELPPQIADMNALLVELDLLEKARAVRRRGDRSTGAGRRPPQPAIRASLRARAPPPRPHLGRARVSHRPVRDPARGGGVVRAHGTSART